MSASSAEASPPAGHAVVLFDGVCNLCSGAVHFIIDRDPEARFRFAALQSPEAAALLAPFGLSAADLDSMVLLEAGQAYKRSTAALRIARRLGGVWRLFYLFIVVPRPLRDAAYDWIAAHRYRWFGKQDRCRVPTPELKARFLK